MTTRTARTEFAFNSPENADWFARHMRATTTHRVWVTVRGAQTIVTIKG